MGQGELEALFDGRKMEINGIGLKAHSAEESSQEF